MRGHAQSAAFSLVSWDQSRRWGEIVRTGRGPDLQFQQSPCHKADHLAKQVGIGTVLYKRKQVHYGFGDRRILRFRLGMRPDPIEKPDGQRKLHYVHGRHRVSENHLIRARAFLC